MPGGARGFHAGGNAGSGIPYVIPNSVRHPMRDHLRHMWPGIHAGCTAGSGPPQVITTTVRDSLRGQGGCGVPGILCRMHNAGSGIPYGIRTYTRDSIRGPGCRTGPGGPSGAPCGVPDLVWATEFHVGFNAGSEPCVVQRCIPH